MIRRALLVLLAGCGEAGSPDASTPGAAATDAMPLEGEVHGLVEVLDVNATALGHGAYGAATAQFGVNGLWVEAFEPSHELTRLGDCAVYEAVPPVCDPLCPANWLCVVDHCVYGYPLDAGTITVSGLTVPDLVVGHDPIPGGILAAGQAVTVRATGATVPAFELTAVTPLALDLALGDTVVLANDQPTQLAWTASPGARYRLSVRSPHGHGGGARYALRCEGEDRGGVSIAPELARLMPELMSPNCWGLTCEVAELERYTTASLGHLELRVGDQLLFWLQHAAP